MRFSRAIALFWFLIASIGSATASDDLDIGELHGCWKLGSNAEDLGSNLCFGRTGSLSYMNWVAREGYGASGSFKISKSKIKFGIKPFDGQLPDGKSISSRPASFDCSVDIDKRVTIYSDEPRTMRIKGCALAGTWEFKCSALTEELECVPKQKVD